MYTNINTNHAIEIIELWFELHDDEIPADFPRKSALLSIKLLMSHNAYYIVEISYKIVMMIMHTNLLPFVSQK